MRLIDYLLALCQVKFKCFEGNIKWQQNGVTDRWLYCLWSWLDWEVVRKLSRNVVFCNILLIDVGTRCLTRWWGTRLSLPFWTFTLSISCGILSVFKCLTASKLTRASIKWLVKLKALFTHLKVLIFKSFIITGSFWMSINNNRSRHWVWCLEVSRVDNKLTNKLPQSNPFIIKLYATVFIFNLNIYLMCVHTEF